MNNTTEVSWSNSTSIDATTPTPSPAKTPSPTQAGAPEEFFDYFLVFTPLFLYVSPILIIGGVIGNSLSFIVLQSRYYRRAPSSFILSALSFVDTGVLLTGLLRHWVRILTDTVLGHSLDMRALTSPGCKVHIYLTYLLPQVSSWSLALMTVERLASVLVPFKAKEMFSRRRMITFWAAITLVLALICTHFFRTAHLFTVSSVDDDNVTRVTKTCTWHDDHKDFSLKIWPWLDFVLISLLPILIIFVSNTVIIVMLARARRLRQQQMQVREDESRSITAMLVSISVVFLLTTTPVSIYFIGNPYWPDDTPHQIRDTLSAYAACNLLYYLSNSTNFLMYCVTGSRFRRTLAAVLCCRKPETRLTSDTAMTNTSRAAGTTAEGAVKTTEA